MTKIRNDNGPKRGCEMPSEWALRASGETDVESEKLHFERVMYDTVSKLDKFQIIKEEDVNLITSNAKRLLQNNFWSLFDSCLDFLLSTEYFLNYKVTEPGNTFELTDHSKYIFVFSEPDNKWPILNGKKRGDHGYNRMFAIMKRLEMPEHEFYSSTPTKMKDQGYYSKNIEIEMNKLKGDNTGSRLPTKDEIESLIPNLPEGSFALQNAHHFLKTGKLL